MGNPNASFLWSKSSRARRAPRHSLALTKHMKRLPERRDGEPLILRGVLITDLDILGHVKSGATSLYVEMPVFRGDGVAFA